MSTIFHIVKMLVVTSIVLILLQMKVGDITLESRLLHWLYSSPSAKYVQETANGTIKFVSDSWKSLTEKNWQTNSSKAKR